MAVWSYPDMSLQDLMKMVKGFIDMLILACGYQSSGRLAHWDSHNIKKALQWALFLEHVMRDLSSSDDYRESLKELDAALRELTSNPHLPQGLAHICSKVLSKASEFMLEHLISVFPLRDEHLKALLTATVEMDFHMHQKTDSRSLLGIFETLMCNTSKSPVPNERKFLMEESLNSSSSGQADDSISCGFSHFTAQALERRQLTVSLISSAETGLNILSSGLRDLYEREDDNALNVNMKHATNFMTEEIPIGSAVWNSWKSRSLSYLLDKRTIRLVSGASLLFSAPKSQWIQVFQRIDISSQLEDSLREIVELMLLGCVVDKWSFLIDRLMLTSYEFVTTSRLYNEVHKFVQRGCREDIINSKEKGIIEYLEVFLHNRLHLLWELSPVLAAFAIPSWSNLFRKYLTELDSQVTGDFSVTRSCSSSKERKEQRECDVAERIWCLHVCHVGGSGVESSSFSA
ncbi:uncharacterized protein LOC132610421 [Lycium barbarum]|uniref:uncharacterized protein LOC132610421 n=1 Tax=Lycium barbarum TaxID=112863 RepID=UPI00293E224F|nr:uncharacterized protein LOC132610421 [Lycium barbarum]XP_060180698.1 uncharacterized protein LOC132610421 [Lycium barbarum]XP_060180699.1 uncharacterized protein LOC132610421 [Lycium barbarum]